MKTILSIILLMIGYLANAQLNYGVEISTQYLSFEMYSRNTEAQFRDKIMPATKLLFYVEPSLSRSQNRIRFGLEASYYTNGYRRVTSYHDGNADVGGAYSHTEIFREKAQFHDLRLGLNSSYLYSFGQKRSTKFELGFDLNISQSIIQKFASQQKSMSGKHSISYNYPSPHKQENSWDQDLGDSITKPEFNSFFVSIMLRTGIRFGKNQNSAIHLSFGVNFSPRINKYQVISSGSTMGNYYEQKTFSLSPRLTGQLHYSYTIGSFHKKKKENKK
ncbi:hypothetical protein [Fluviicola taffensis]|uniref:Outer membrane protein beta-barrel domain-containing protein n=1 Tax=Fluviicola taffensis (strain DSM 16823 / NCIMB 13979 / RW262) TaxID=755732 RepID=F2II92_FLUTR|nr:hypothetical protein [Fluviicola taffensis]AEA43801.1 hypothetical protein Fluta_1813 [Fluviicola taffensis DSM 16823]